MLKKLNRKSLGKWLARYFPGRFSQLYSTLDEPQRVPVQEAAYLLAAQKCLHPGDWVLDVGFGLGYGFEIFHSAFSRPEGAPALHMAGVDIDHKAVQRARQLYSRSGEPLAASIQELRVYDGKTLPYADRSMDVVTCVDVIEHVPDYLGLLSEMVRLARRAVLVSTPNRRPEYTRPDGRPRNPWHLREWSADEFAAILAQLPGIRIEWHFLDGLWDGPFQISSSLTSQTLALSPILWLADHESIR